jgi:tRNA(Ile)-lysidine synthase
MGHQADDQVETFLHHLLRGSGPSGLSGIQTFRAINALVDIVRPLLRVHRCEILDYLRDRKQTYRDDSSNATLDYTRNRIRNELLPSLRTFANSQSLDVRLLQARELIAEEHAAFVELADRWLAKIGYASEESLVASDETQNGIKHFSVPIPMCRNEPWPIIREALVMIWHRMNWPMREMNHKHWRKLQTMIELASQTTHPKRLELPGQIVATCRKGMFRLERVQS